MGEGHWNPLVKETGKYELRLTWKSDDLGDGSTNCLKEVYAEKEKNCSLEP